MASCSDCTEEQVVEDSVDSDVTTSPLRTNRHHFLGREFPSQTFAGLSEPVKGMENSREEPMFSSSEEENSEQSQLLLPQSLQMSPHLGHLKPADSPVFPQHLQHPKMPPGVFPQHLGHLKPPGENSPVFPPPAKIRKLAGKTRTEGEPVADVDSDEDVTKEEPDNVANVESDTDVTKEETVANVEKETVSNVECDTDVTKKETVANVDNDSDVTKVETVANVASDSGVTKVETVANIDIDSDVTKKETVANVESDTDVTKVETVANIDNDSDVTNLSDNNVENQLEHDLGDATCDLAGKEQDGGEGMKGCHGDQSSKCSWEKRAAVQDSADRSAAATEGVEKTRLSEEAKMHGERDLEKERITEENGRKRSKTCVEEGKKVESIQKVSEGSVMKVKKVSRIPDVLQENVEKNKEATKIPGISKESIQKSNEGTRTQDISEESVEMGKEGTRTTDVSEGNVEKCKEARRTQDISQHEEEMQLLGKLEGRQEKLNPLLSTTDRAAVQKVRRELSCIQTLIGTLIQAHQRQRKAISALRDSEQMQQQMQLFVQRHKRLVQIFSVQKTATAKFKGQMKVTATQSYTKVTAQKPPLSTSTRTAEAPLREAGTTAVLQTLDGSSMLKETSSLHRPAAQKPPLSTSVRTAEAPLREASSTTAVLQTLDGSSMLRAVMKTGSLQMGQIVDVVSKDGQESVRYRVVGTESVANSVASTSYGVAPNIQHGVENVANSTATVVSNVGHINATALSPASSKLAPAFRNNQLDPNIQHSSENVAKSTATVVSNVAATTLSPASSKLAQLAQQANATTDSSNALLKARAWKPPFRPSNVASPVDSLSEEKTQDISEVTETNARKTQEEKLKNLKGKTSEVSVQSRAEVLWQKIVPKQLVTSAKTVASAALKDCLVGSKGLSTTGVAVGQLQGLSTSGRAGGQLQGLSATGGQFTQGMSTSVMVGGQYTQGLSTTAMAGGQLQGLSTTVGGGGQLQGLSTTGVAGGGGQPTQGLSTTGVVEGLPQTQGSELPTVSELLRTKLVHPGKDVLSCKGKGGLQFASLSPEGAVQTRGGLTFSSVTQWYRAVWGHRSAQKRAIVYRQVCYKGTPLAEFSSVVAPATSPPTYLEQTGVTPAGKNIPPAPAHLSSIRNTCSDDVEMLDEQQPASQSQQQQADVSLPSSGSTSPGKTQDVLEDLRFPRPASILLITDKEFFVSRLRLPHNFWDSAEVKLNQFLEAALIFE
ncbi:Serine/threonine-protein kinase dclk3 [Branchiostoma belcheri]|nr:Serine/threonine-protein kinase dclk3 [Branchiostoma belcheri]